MRSINVKPRKERLQGTDESPQDFISNLPQGLIFDILSRVHTKDAVRTSVLSSKWKCLWMSIHNITIHDAYNCFIGKKGIASFNRALTRILLRTQNSRLRSFVLLCNREGHRPCDIETWISQVLMRNTQKLVIFGRKIKGLHSPWCFSSGCTALTMLYLIISCTLKFPTNNCFPNLKRLGLGSGEHGNIKIMTFETPTSGRVILIFPALEYLYMRDCEWLDVNYVEIQAPELIGFDNYYTRELKIYKFKICGPKLAIFELFNRGPANDFVLNAPAVTYATINSLEDGVVALQAYNILKKFPNLKCLRIAGLALQALLSLEMGLVIPTFARLKELEVNFECDIKYVFKLLQVLPPLEALTITVYNFDDFEFGEALTPKILCQLKKVKLLNFTATRGQYDLATCLLMNAKNRQEMTFNLFHSANFKIMTILDSDGKYIGIVEAIGQSLSKLKPEGSSCELVLEEKDARSKWVNPWPKVNGDLGSKTRIVYE